MTRELELAAAGSVGGLFRRRKTAHPAHTQTHCLNCGAELHGRYCHDCGQSADDHHRSILHLIWEAVEGFTHLDGRLAKTLPALLLHPARLARDHIEGRRSRHVPPFRLFLISLLIFMLAMEGLFHGAVRTQTGVNGPIDPNPHRTVYSFKRTPIGSTNIVFQDRPNLTGAAAAHQSRRHVWLTTHIQRALQNGDYYRLLVFDWAHRLAILLLPILAGLLTLLYVYKRQFYVYDHLVVAMQFLSFVFLLFALAWLIPDPVQSWALLAACVWTPVNLFMLLRGAYGSSVLGAVVKTVILSGSTVLLFVVLLIGLLALALRQM